MQKKNFDIYGLTFWRNVLQLFWTERAIKERLLIKVISTICCLIDGSCVWIIKVDYPRPWSFWHSWSQINYNCPPGPTQYKYASLEVASNWAPMGHILPDIHYKQNGLSRHEICQKIYTTGFFGRKMYTLKVRKLRLFLLKKKQRKCINISNLSNFLVGIPLSD